MERVNFDLQMTSDRQDKIAEIELRKQGVYSCWIGDFDMYKLTVVVGKRDIGHFLITPMQNRRKFTMKPYGFSTEQDAERYVIAAREWFLLQPEHELMYKYMNNIVRAGYFDFCNEKMYFCQDCRESFLVPDKHEHRIYTYKGMRMCDYHYPGKKLWPSEEL